MVQAAQDQDSLWLAAADEFGPAFDRLARAWEMDPEKRRDLLQEIHLQLSRSFAKFDARCSLRTWVYRIAHNVATSYVIRERRRFASLSSLEELENLPDQETGPDRRLNLERLSN